MNVPQAEHIVVLAASGWGELIPLIFIIGVSVVSAITRALNKSGANSKSEKEKTSRLVEMAKRYKEMQESGQQRSIPKEHIPYARTERTAAERKPGSISEWDRRQQEKKQQIARRREQNQPPPRYVEPQTPPGFEPEPSEVIPVAMPVQQPEPFRPAYKPPKIQTKPRPKRASQQTYKQPGPQPVELPIAKPVKHQKSAENKETVAAKMSLSDLLRKNKSLRSAIILKEILDKPIGLRESW